MNKVLVAASLFALYVIWGATYFAMHVALTWLPPFLMAGPRFILAGSILAALLLTRGEALPTRREWRGAIVTGVLLLVFGNGFVALAQRTVESGVAATVVATMPLWLIAMGSLVGERPSAREVIGLLTGFCGVALLNRAGNLSFLRLDALLLMLAPMSWALGSLLARRLVMPRGMMSAAAQMLVAGVVMTAVALARGERPLGPPSVSALGAMAFLVVFGSLLAFSAYGYLLRNVRPSLATSYAYVNPLVALSIGAALGGEALTPTKLAACLLTVAGVVVVVARPRAAPPPPRLASSE